MTYSDTPTGTPPTGAVTTVPSAPAAGQNDTGWLDVAGILPWALLAALLTATVYLWLARRTSRLQEVARLRELFAAASEAQAAYKEFPYAIQLRRHDEPGEKPVRISQAVREVQAQFSYFTTWTATESAEVGQAYADLAAGTRRVAGIAMREAREAPPLDNDAGMNIPPGSWT